MSDRLKGKRAFITAGAAGIGRACALAFAREGATVSMPLDWSAVKKGLDPKRFTLRTAPGLIRKSTAWKDYARSAKPLLPVLKRLAKG